VSPDPTEVCRAVFHHGDLLGLTAGKADGVKGSKHVMTNTIFGDLMVI
jgi:hypothetical protein